MTTNPVLVTYAGLAYAIYNKTSDCARGVQVDTKTKRLVGSYSCDTPNYREPELDLFEPLADNDTTIRAPQIMSQKLTKVVYCAYHNLTVNSEIVPCPPWPFVMALSQNFSTTGYIHRAEKNFL